MEKLPDRAALSEMMVDMTGRAVRRHLRKADEQEAAIKERLGLPDAAGIVVLMNEAEPMVDAGAITYTIKAALKSGTADLHIIHHV